jgi:thymidylate kinase
MRNRAMFTVALIGPDGSGKTTVARHLEQVLPRAEYIYMGVKWEASNHLLPTTRLAQWAMGFHRRWRPVNRDGPALRGGELRVGDKPNRVNRGRRLYRWLRVRSSLANLIAEEWYRQMVTWAYLLGGRIVIFDRHFFFDYYIDHVASAERPLHRRVHGFLLSRVYPKPDLVIYLDAPPEMLFARKGEGTIEWLERRKGDYLAHASSIGNFLVVDASRPLREVTDDIVAAISRFSSSRSLTTVP